MTEKELERIIDRYSRLLWSVASKILDRVGGEQDVEECVADVFIDLWNRPQEFDQNRGSIKAFLCLKCRGKAIDRFRSITRHLTEELDSDQVMAITGPLDSIMMTESLNKLCESIDRLDEPEREIMIRRFILEQKPAEIARITKLPVRKVENILYRTKEKLRKELGGIYE